MKQRFPRRTRPLVAVAAILFASFGIAAASHVVRTGPDLYARLAVIQVLRAPDEKVRIDALAFLNKIGPRGLHAVTTRAREGPIPDELFAIVARFGDEPEIDILAENLAALSNERRMLAVGALARIGSEASARAAGPALADISPEVRSLAHDALRGHPEEILRGAVQDALGAPSFQPDFVCSVLVDEGVVAAAVEPVAAGLRSDDPIRVYNSLALARATFPRYPPGSAHDAVLVSSIVAALPRLQSSAQEGGIEVLAALSGPEAQGALCDAATSRSLGAAARLLAISSLGRRAGPRVIASLEDVIRTGPVEFRLAAANALALTASEADSLRWMDTIEKNGMDVEGREALLHAVALRGSVTLVPRLFALAHSSDSPGLIDAIHRLLSTDAHASVPYLLDELKGAQPQPLLWLDGELRSLTGHETRIVGAWRTTEDFEKERAAVNDEWGRWWKSNKDGSPDEWRTSAQRETQEGLRSSKPTERADAVARLIALAPPDLDARLIEMLDDPADVVWGPLQGGLVGSATSTGNDLLRGRLTGASPRAASRAARLLGLRSDWTSVNALIAAVKAGDMTVRKEAAASLGRLRDASASRPLMTLLREQDTSLRQAAIAALSQIADRSIEGDLLDGLGSSEKVYRAACITLLGACGSRLAIRPLIKCFRDADENAQQSAMRSFQALTGIMPSVLDPAESEIRNWETLVERRQR